MAKHTMHNHRDNPWFKDGYKEGRKEGHEAGYFQGVQQGYRKCLQELRDGGVLVKEPPREP